MIVTTPYPQIPLTTSNVATDLARVDNQQKPVILPPQEPAKSHEERSFNPQNERARAYVVAGKKQQQQQSTRQQQNSMLQNSMQQAVAPKAVARPKTSSMIASHTPALQRKDIQLKNPSPNTKTTAEPSQRQPLAAGVSPAMLQQFGQRIGQFYQQQSVPHVESQLQLLA